MDNKINSKNDIESPKQALLYIKLILTSASENNWIRGINYALIEIENEQSCENAKSIIKTMMQSGRGFSEYYVNTGSAESRQNTNQQLELLKDYLWEWAST